MHGGWLEGGRGVDWGLRVGHGRVGGVGMWVVFIGLLFLLTWRWDYAVFAHVGLVSWGRGEGGFVQRLWVSSQSLWCEKEGTGDYDRCFEH